MLRADSAAPAFSGAAVRALVAKGGLAIADQALFASANFLVSVLLARGLEPVAYGAFSLANSALLFLAALHQAVLLEPMMIFGAGKHRDGLGRYFRLLAVFHASILAPASVAMWGIAILLSCYYSPAAGRAFAAAALASGFVLWFWFVRRIFYVLAKPQWSVLASSAYFLLMAAALAMLGRVHRLAPSAAFLAMAVSSVLASLAVLARVPARDLESDSLTFSRVAREHWNYGRWAMGSALMSWFPSNIYYVLLAAWLGLDGVAALRAVTNFVMPVMQAITAVNLLMIPSLVRDLAAGGVRKMERGMILFLELYGISCVVYLAALWMLRHSLFSIAYAGRYMEYSGWPLLLAAALPLGASVYSVIGNGLRALERPDRMIWAFFGSSAAAIVFGIPLTAKFGVAGAIAGNHCSAAIFIAMLWRAYRSAARARSK